MPSVDITLLNNRVHVHTSTKCLREIWRKAQAMKANQAEGEGQTTRAQTNGISDTIYLWK